MDGDDGDAPRRHTKTLPPAVQVQTLARHWFTLGCVDIEYLCHNVYVPLRRVAYKKLLFDFIANAYLRLNAHRRCLCVSSSDWPDALSPVHAQMR